MKTTRRVDEAPILVTDFTDKASRRFRSQMLVRSKRDKKTPIVIYVDSWGGSVYALMAMVDVMGMVPNPVYTVCNGKAMSAGAILLAAGDVVFATPHATIMLHQASSWVNGHINDVKVSVQETERIDILCDEIVAKKTKKSLAFIRKLYTHERRDVYLNPEQALAMKLIDHIGIPEVLTETTHRFVVREI